MLKFMKKSDNLSSKSDLQLNNDLINLLTQFENMKTENVGKSKFKKIILDTKKIKTTQNTFFKDNLVTGNFFNKSKKITNPIKKTITKKEVPAKEKLHKNNTSDFTMDIDFSEVKKDNKDVIINKASTSNIIRKEIERNLRSDIKKLIKPVIKENSEIIKQASVIKKDTYISIKQKLEKIKEEIKEREKKLLLQQKVNKKTTLEKQKEKVTQNTHHTPIKEIKIIPKENLENTTTSVAIPKTIVSPEIKIPQKEEQLEQDSNSTSKKNTDKLTVIILILCIFLLLITWFYIL